MLGQCGLRAYVVERMVRAITRTGHHSYGVMRGARLFFYRYVTPKGVSFVQTCQSVATLLRAARLLTFSGSFHKITLRLSHPRPGDFPPHSSGSRCRLCRCQTDYSSAPCYR